MPFSGSNRIIIIDNNDVTSILTCDTIFTSDAAFDKRHTILLVSSDAAFDKRQEKINNVKRNLNICC